jgi:hypothetical protein
MARKWLDAAVLIVATTCANSALAQYQETKSEITGIIGRTFISDHHVVGMSVNSVVTSGNGLTFEGNYARRLWGYSGLIAVNGELPVVFDWKERLNLSTANLIPFSYNSFFVTPSARVNLFPQTAFSPWISLGGGLGRFGESSNLEFGGKNPGSTGTITGTLQLGLGLDVKIWGPLGVRGQLRDFYSGAPQLNVPLGSGRQHNLFTGGGVTFHF